MPATWRGWREDICPKADSPRPPATMKLGGKSFYKQREGATGRNSTVSSDSHLEIGHQWSDRHLLDCFTVSLQFHGWLVPISLRPVLETVEAYVMAIIWSSRS